jgi:hypothetical protein
MQQVSSRKNEIEVLKFRIEKKIMDLEDVYERSFPGVNENEEKTRNTTINSLQ